MCVEYVPLQTNQRLLFADTLRLAVPEVAFCRVSLKLQIHQPGDRGEFATSMRKEIKVFSQKLQNPYTPRDHWPQAAGRAAEEH